ncbi:TIGR04283 family arsenosugar biosynthesis glycosyltransferase [Hydrogenophaga sp.]|uniref:TIGR04283 family arsenosugar biosynthesis glycosyltransferase n=1 Tax=Hydrogenophaga sp. TaxID=1904254 RepID=UPI002ABAD64B|nr:TIGR04283 family arsenosugar biosynthesis glycosyltransferase [Hydrogenophaga sp.]MDZ4397715.1 TIGR04283 family arsenosugar biosynthesis glycosyltransferase [Hydrogenophaga sp.]
MKLAVVVPVLNEAATLALKLQALAPLRARGAELIVVDGGSTDGTLAIAQALADRVLQAPRGRASQLNAGAAVTRADVLLFLHADTQLPADADQLIEPALQHGHRWGRFDVHIEGRHQLLPLVAWFMNRRSRLTGIATGDQAMFVQRRLFESVGGFAALPLMEDIDLSQRLKAIEAPACLRECVTTSGRRWDQRGFWRTVLLMWRLRAAHALGTDAHTLALRYGYRPRAPASVAIMAKAPVAGLAKTRLIPLLGAAGAARAQRGFALRTLATARSASTGEVTLWCAPDAAHRFFRALAVRRGVATMAQPAGDIGQRMAAAMQHHFARAPHTPLLIAGTDCPVLTPSHLQQAADALQDHDAVLIPAEDGGYVLIGLRRPVPEVFTEVPWSTAQVLGRTRERLRGCGASWQELPSLWDVDEPADWLRWQAQREHGSHGTPWAAGNPRAVP